MMEKLKDMKERVLTTTLIDKQGYDQKLKILNQKLSKNNQISRDELDKSLGLMPINEKTGK